MLFPSWTHILSPSELKDHYTDRTPTVYCACLRGHRVPRLGGIDDMGILFIGYAIRSQAGGNGNRSVVGYGGKEEPAGGNGNNNMTCVLN